MTKLNPKSLVKQLKELDPPPAALMLLCPDNIRIQRILDYLLESYYKKPEITRMSAKDLVPATLNSLQDQLCSLSLFSSSSVYLINQIQDIKSNAAKILLEILKKAPVGNTVFVTGTKLPATSILYKHFSSKNLLIKLSEMKNPELKKWVKKELLSFAFSDFPDNVLPTLIDLGQNAPDKIHALVKHLALYLDSDKLSEKDIFDVFVSHPNPNEFALIDAICQGNRIAAENTAMQLLRAGKNPILLLSLLGRSFSNYLRIKELQRLKHNPTQLQQQLNMQPWVFKKNLSAANKYSLERLEIIMQKILRADSILKNKSLGPEAVFSSLIHDLAA